MKTRKIILSLFLIALFATLNAQTVQKCVITGFGIKKPIEFSTIEELYTKIPILKKGEAFKFSSGDTDLDLKILNASVNNLLTLEIPADAELRTNIFPILSAHKYKDVRFDTIVKLKSADEDKRDDANKKSEWWTKYYYYGTEKLSFKFILYNNKKTNTYIWKWTEINGIIDYTTYMDELEKTSNEEKGFGFITNAELAIKLEAEEERVAAEKKAEEERLAAEREAELEKKRKDLFKKIELLIKEGEDYEKKNRYCYALGKYYEAVLIEKENIDILEITNGCDKWIELFELIENGNPGRGQYTKFQLHDAWKNLLIDAEKYGTEYGMYSFKFAPIELESLNYENKTANYKSKVTIEISERIGSTLSAILLGYEKSYRDDWNNDLPSPSIWPTLSCVSANESKSNLINGVAVFRERSSFYSWGKILTHDEIVRNAFACENIGFIPDWFYGYGVNLTLYDVKYNITDKNGNILVKDKRQLVWNKKPLDCYLEINNIPESIMASIDSGEAKINLTGIYLQYGNFDNKNNPFSTDEFYNHSRSIIKTLSEVLIPADKIEWSYGSNE
ncbi:MAG: hypothetical protein KBT11_11725 [Treponema sp.]|nr:hypothetical protein [Candidatus Treponema equifaecale]